MAYVALVSLRRTLEKILNQNQYSISLHHEQQIRSINEPLILLQELADGFPGGSHCLEGQIWEVSNEAQDIIERFISEKLRRPSSLSSYVLGFSFNQHLGKIRAEIDSILRETKKMERKGNTTQDDLKLKPSDSPPRFALPTKTKNADSLDDDLVAIKSRLCGGSLKLQVVPIVGMGGIGKTTLATNVYNDPLTAHYFDVRAWVTVSQDYRTQKIVSSLVDSVKELGVKISGQSDEETVYRSLKGRRYLIVVDDMWSTNAWDDLRSLFPDDHNGSRILLTTRLSDVAAYSDSQSPLHEMRFMSIEQSWELIRQRVFAFADEDCSPELENIGKKIAKNCRGLPLAVVVIAGLLSTVEKNRDSWLEIAKNVSSIVVTEDGQFDEILSLSYTHLPHHLRLCFLYMGGFPEDHEIPISKLVRLWVAEGFLRNSEVSCKSLEEEAEECLEDLVNRNLVLVRNKKYNGRIISCSLHDLIRDLCIRKSQESNFFGNITDIYVERRLFIEIIKDQHRRKSFVTIDLFRRRKRVRLRRVLDAGKADVQLLPKELFKLFHLRYLAIGFKFGFMISAAISKLQNLQTLIIHAGDQWRLVARRPDVDCLPQEIWMMPQLRHLICYGRLPPPKEATSTLQNLQTLSLVFHDVLCVEGIVEKIPSLKKLGIDCSYYDYGTHLNNLVYLHQLESLKLRNADWQKDGVCFPSMLRKLTLHNMSLPWSEMGIVGSLPNLQVLKLRSFACIGSTWETSEGEFPELQYLLIETSKLQHWSCESHHFPRLRFLLLHDCWYLNEIPECIGEIATLEVIDIRGRERVPTSLVESAKRIQEEQQSWGNDALQVHNPPPESWHRVSFPEPMALPQQMYLLDGDLLRLGQQEEDEAAHHENQARKEQEDSIFQMAESC